MPCYIVTFEVADPNRKGQLKDKLKGYGTFCPINENCWAIVTSERATQIRDKLIEFVQPSDKLFVIKSGVEAAWRNVYGPKNTDWLKEYL